MNISKFIAIRKRHHPGRGGQTDIGTDWQVIRINHMQLVAFVISDINIFIIWSYCQFCGISQIYGTLYAGALYWIYCDRCKVAAICYINSFFILFRNQNRRGGYSTIGSPGSMDQVIGEQYRHTPERSSSLDCSVCDAPLVVAVHGLSDGSPHGWLAR